MNLPRCKSTCSGVGKSKFSSRGPTKFKIDEDFRWADIYKRECIRSLRDLLLKPLRTPFPDLQIECSTSCLVGRLTKEQRKERQGDYISVKPTLTMCDRENSATAERRRCGTKSSGGMTGRMKVDRGRGRNLCTQGR